jgi:FKBP-type peptidyl-prolyl cis-trans isomerase FklB
MKNGTIKTSAIIAIGLSALAMNVYAQNTQSTQSTQGAQTTTTTTTSVQAAPAAGAQMTDADKAKIAGQAFLNANKTKPGVVTLPDGLQYQVIKEGAGVPPKATDTVKVNYEGTLINGTVFDSSYKRGQPISFPVNGVIPGWVEALQLMKPGAVWMLYIPSELAYGTTGAPPAIGPNETLIFKVELLGVNQ